MRVRVSALVEGAARPTARAVNTNAQGRFRLTGFRQGVYTVRVTRTGFGPETLRDMRRGDENLRFVLRRR